MRKERNISFWVEYFYQTLFFYDQQQRCASLQLVVWS
jgi:hypothetical protein